MTVVSKVQEDLWVVLRCVCVTLIISSQVSQPGSVVSLACSAVLLQVFFFFFFYCRFTELGF